MVSNKTATIRNEAELAREFGKLIAYDYRLEPVRIKTSEHSESLSLNLDGRTHRFTPRFLLRPSISDIPVHPDPKAASQPLLVVPRLSDAFLDACRKRHVSVADLNGRIFLRARGLLVSISQISGRNFRFEQEPRNIFVGKSARIVRSLLARPSHLWRQAELIERTGATSGLVSRVVTYLTRQGLLKKIDARRFHVVSPLALLDAWAEADEFSHRVMTHRFTTLDADPLNLARKIRKVLARGGLKFAFTQWIAAWLRQPYTEPSVVSLYVPHLPVGKLLSDLDLRPVSEAGRVWFHVPSDEGVFRETRLTDDLQLVSDAQIYLDLLDAGLRGPEQAQGLREWVGFLSE